MDLTLLIIIIINAISIIFNAYCGLKFIKARKEMESTKDYFNDRMMELLNPEMSKEKNYPEDLSKSYTHSRPSPKGKQPDKRPEYRKGNL